MKSFISILLFIFTITCSDAWSKTPKHFVFMVHGIGATPSTFGPMKEPLLREASGFDRHTDWQFTSFSYDTGNDTKDVMDFARELGDFITKKFDEQGGLHHEDKFSLIMHSQGGLIGLNLVLNSFKGHTDFHPKLKNHIDAFITLGTPYWGAKVAIFANRMMPILAYLKIPLKDKWGDEELRDMELASDFSSMMREEIITPDNSEIIQQIKNQVRFLVFSGVTERLNFLAPFATGKGRYEDDTAVPIPSSRLDFLYYIDSKKYNDHVSSDEFKYTGLIDPENYVVVNSFHASPLPQNKNAPGIAKLPDRCANISYRDCDHPTYPLLVQHLFKLERSPAFVRDLTSFAVDLKLKFKGLPVDKKRMSISFKAMTYGLWIGKGTELYNNVSRWTEEGDFRLYHTGTIDPKKTSSTLGKIQITIKTPGFKERVIMVPVKTALSTYLELDLEKEK